MSLLRNDEQQTAVALPATFRDVMAAAPAPVTVITTGGAAGEAARGATVSAFMSLSMDPMLVVVSLDRRSSVLAAVETNGAYGVNLLAVGQQRLAGQFARSGDDKFAGVAWRLDSGLPRLERTAGWVACRLHAVLDGGDHKLLVGAVVDVHRSPRTPMVYSEREFGIHSRIQLLGAGN